MDAVSIEKGVQNVRLGKKDSSHVGNLRKWDAFDSIADRMRWAGHAMLAPHSRDRYSGILVSSGAAIGESPTRRRAGVAELAYAADLKSVGRKTLWVQIPPPVPELPRKPSASTNPAKLQLASRCLTRDGSASLNALAPGSAVELVPVAAWAGAAAADRTAAEVRDVCVGPWCDGRCRRHLRCCGDGRRGRRRRGCWRYAVWGALRFNASAARK